ncbi:flavin reductase family protein [Mogibacterium pumilum]|uniref:Flavin reductase like domain-containing protein n=1 Tax=Mogibacterium pumilum TaxID=86332 RepID=A0A223ATY5_9FIRM|nr:flavin reductase family protein [Mogibacterium pumilum]ASS38447.1 hypothetical protein AXF17_08615 [Mogibacterium pumilum]
MSNNEKIKIKPGTLLYPLPAVMVTAGTIEKNNIITIAWTGIINTDPAILYISVKKSRYSHALISEAGEFVINLTTEKLARATDFAGVRSGKNFDKVKELGLTLIPGETNDTPMIAESPINLECKVMEVHEYPTHDMFIAEVVDAHISAEFVNENGSYDFGRMNLLAYNHGGYYGLDDEDMGRFGFSVMKEKTKCRKEKEERRARRQAMRRNSVKRQSEQKGGSNSKSKHKSKKALNS